MSKQFSDGIDPGPARLHVAADQRKPTSYDPSLRRFLTASSPPRQRETMSRFDTHVTRDGGWWMVHSKLGGRTQARYPSEVEPMAREYIAVSTGTPIDQVAINWRRCTL